jgi:hypothetical protein
LQVRLLQRVGRGMLGRRRSQVEAATQRTARARLLARYERMMGW